MIRIVGYCPMGCGQNLFVGDGGYITCSYSKCPEPDAVSTLLEDRESEHLVSFGDVGFTIRHPLRERLRDQLMDCDLHAYCASLPGPLIQPGPVRMRQTVSGDWVVIPPRARKK